MIANVLYLSGFVSGEFGVLRAPGDLVLMDFINCLYMREFSGKSYSDTGAVMLERTSGAKHKCISFEMTIPMIREAELVAARCLEQVGKNLHLNQDVIGQLQMAVIEACINAMEHSKGEDGKIYLSVDLKEDRLEISIESTGREFVSQEVGEPFVGRGIREDDSRGWGVKLMKNFTDSVRFEKTERGTRVVLVKKLQGAVEADKNETAANE